MKTLYFVHKALMENHSQSHIELVLVRGSWIYLCCSALLCAKRRPNQPGFGWDLKLVAGAQMNSNLRSWKCARRNWKLLEVSCGNTHKNDGNRGGGGGDGHRQQQTRYADRAMDRILTLNWVNIVMIALTNHLSGGNAASITSSS